MPGKQPRAGEHPLSRPQSVIAAQILREHFDPSVNTQMDMSAKNTLLAMVNEAFEAKGLPGTYSLRKMEDWRANCVYRWKCRQQKKKPDCWGTDGRKRCRKARKSREGVATDAPGVAGGAIQKVNENGQIHAEAFAHHMAHEGMPLLGMPGDPMHNNSIMMNDSFAVPSPIMPQAPSAALAYGTSSRADEIMMIASSSRASPGLPASGVATGKPVSTSKLNEGYLAAAGSNGAQVKDEPQRTSWIAPSPGATAPTPAPAERQTLPPSLASVMADPLSGATPMSPLAVSPPSSLGANDSIRDPKDFDGMVDSSTVKTEQQIAAEALPSSAAKFGKSPALRSSLGGLGSPSWSNAGFGMSPWAPPGSISKQAPAPDGAGMATMAAIEEEAASSMAMTKGASDMAPPPARRSSFGLTPLGVRSQSQTNGNTPGYATLPKLSLSPAGSWLASPYPSWAN